MVAGKVCGCQRSCWHDAVGSRRLGGTLGDTSPGGVFDLLRTWQIRFHTKTVNHTTRSMQRVEMQVVGEMKGEPPYLTLAKDAESIMEHIQKSPR
jgi:hypothetical protein